jgi:hypothetical protein
MIERDLQALCKNFFNADFLSEPRRFEKTSLNIDTRPELAGIVQKKVFPVAARYSGSIASGGNTNNRPPSIYARRNRS